MLPCRTCAYRVNLAGSAHYACDFDWIKWTTAQVEAALVLPAGEARAAALMQAVNSPALHEVSPKVQQWYAFPFNFDPLWGPDTCPGHTLIGDPTKRAPSNPMTEVLRILGGRA